MSTASARRVIITGGASGIGAAVARKIRAQGGSVGLVDVDRARLDAIAAQGDGGVLTTCCSVADESQLRAAHERLEDAIGGPIDGLVNAAGIPERPVSIEEQDSQAWRAVLDSHLTGTYLACKVFGSRMAAGGGGGSIVNVASVLAMRPGPVLAYGAAKSAILNLTQSLAVRWAACGVRVNAVAPGWTDTPFMRRADRSERDLQVIVDAIPQRRLIEPDEIADVIGFLLSRESRCMTGATITCDAGFSAGAGWAPYGGFGARDAG